MALADLPIGNPDPEVREHVGRYIGFERMVLFAVMHIALILACLALAFIGHVPLLAFLFFLGGSLSTIAGFVIYSASHEI